MPLYGTLQCGGGVTALWPGDGPLALFNAETLAAGNASIAFNRAYSPSGDDAGMTFQISFATAPTAVVEIQGSNTDADAAYVNLFTSTNQQQDWYTDLSRWGFYRAKLVSQSAGGALTVTVKR